MFVPFLCKPLEELRLWVFIKDGNRAFGTKAHLNIRYLKSQEFKKLGDTWALDEFLSLFSKLHL